MADPDKIKNPEIERLRALQEDAQRDIERIAAEETAGNRGGRGQKPERGDSGGKLKSPINSGLNKGQQDGSFASKSEPQKPVGVEIPRKPVAGQEVTIKSPENKVAKLILELGKISFAIKTIYLYLSKCTSQEDTESDDVTNEKARLTIILGELLSASNDLINFISSQEEKPTMGDLEITKSQSTVVIMEILWEIDNLDLKISKRLPKKNTVEWRKLEIAKNQLRKFIGDNESITDIPPTLRPDAFTPKPASAGPVETVKSPEEIATKKLSEEKEKNGGIIERRKSGEDFTVEKLIGEGYSKEVATTFVNVLRLIKVQVAV